MKNNQKSNPFDVEWNRIKKEMEMPKEVEGTMEELLLKSLFNAGAVCVAAQITKKKLPKDGDPTEQGQQIVKLFNNIVQQHKDIERSKMKVKEDE